MSAWKIVEVLEGRWHTTNLFVMQYCSNVMIVFSNHDAGICFLLVLFSGRLKLSFWFPTSKQSEKFFDLEVIICGYV
uniref:Uncharacterized protein n=1 Tax=Rhizophora mucronata TaxID=61149 RepID=A0A2P2PQ79_RHIMU